LIAIQKGIVWLSYEISTAAVLSGASITKNMITKKLFVDEVLILVFETVHPYNEMYRNRTL